MRPPTHCHLCGAPEAPFHFRRPGHLSAVPAAERGKSLRACRECRTQARARWEAKFLPKRRQRHP